MPARPAAVPDPGVERRLHHEPVVWVTTVRPDGRPHVVPTWFWWDGSAFLVFSKPHAVKVANLGQQPTVMLALGDPTAADFDVLLVEGEASLLPDATARVLPSAHLAKYRTWLQAIGLDGEEYAATYSQPVPHRPDAVPGMARADAARDGRHGRNRQRRACLAGIEPVRRVRRAST
ncbi:MAG TPA: pyridoxamine 5'-phosphate oxidase family protein, partial [Candidatus Limnocylindrales bacterium]